MMNDPQLWKLAVIALRFENRIHHGMSVTAPKRVKSTILLISGRWLRLCIEGYRLNKQSDDTVIGTRKHSISREHL